MLDSDRIVTSQGVIIRTGHVNHCYKCGKPINRYNDSEWEVFTSDGTTTQPICWMCSDAIGKITKKSDA